MSRMKSAMCEPTTSPASLALSVSGVDPECVVKLSPFFPCRPTPFGLTLTRFLFSLFTGPGTSVRTLRLRHPAV